MKKKRFLLTLALLFFLALMPLFASAAATPCNTCGCATPCSGVYHRVYTSQTVLDCVCVNCINNNYWNYQCDAGECGAECQNAGNCTATCSGSTIVSGGHCHSDCSCDYTSGENCATKASTCTSVSNYRDYVTCSGGACTYTDYDSDSGQTYCDACKGAGYWNLGGEISDTTCCEDAADNKVTRVCTNGCTTLSSDDGCCSAATDCVYGSTCYTTGWSGAAPWDAGKTGSCTAGSWSELTSCTYTSGNWVIQCSDSCTLSTPVDLGGNTITFNGAGTVTITADITNWSRATVQGGCHVTSSDGGGLKSGVYADLAEYMPLALEDFEPGDVVTSRLATNEEKADSLTNEPFIGVKSTIPYDQNLLGIVSYSNVPALGTKLNNNYLPVALAGRVPVKASTENGAIEIGDYLTSSSKPGIAMKATRAGSVIGKALESYDNSDPNQISRVLVLVNLIWYGGESSGFAINPDGTIGSASGVSDANFISNLIAGIKQLGVDIANGVIKAVKLVVEEVKTRVLRIAVEKGRDNTIGSGTIPAQQIEYRVNNSLVEANSKIFISFTSDAGGRSCYVSEKVAGVGFTIKLSDVTPEPLDFDYWIVLVEEDTDYLHLPTGGEAGSYTNEPYCGDGIVNATETCDDGNNTGGDGCSAGCIIETSQIEPEPTPEPASVEEPVIEPITEPITEPIIEPEASTPEAQPTESPITNPVDAI